MLNCGYVFFWGETSVIIDGKDYWRRSLGLCLRSCALVQLISCSAGLNISVHNTKADLFGPVVPASLAKTTIEDHPHPPRGAKQNQFPCKSRLIF
eukprot:5391646-Amphidinium_carterae.1